MRFYLTSTALALVLAAGASTAQAETLITQPGQTVQTLRRYAPCARSRHVQSATKW